MLRHLLFAAAALASAGAARAQALSAYSTAGEEQAAMSKGAVTSEALVKADLDRIEKIDRRGPKLNSVISVNPKALDEARAMDRERKAGHIRGPLHGVPILLKDNIETADQPTTAGSLALLHNDTHRDSPVAARLKAAGAVILGKTNLSEWANFRSTRSISGWSAVGGLVRNPYELDRTACGSSAGSGAAVAAGLAGAAIGTETDGSVTCPSAMNGVAGLKPTVGLVPRTFIVPISAEQDTAGPMARSVADVAAILTAIAGSDPADPATAEADAHKTNYLAALKPGALSGARIGIMRQVVRGSPGTDEVFEKALATLKAQGAVLVDVTLPAQDVRTQLGTGEGEALRTEFKATLNAYLATTPPAVTARTLEALIAFDKTEPREMPLFGQEIFEQAQAKPPITDPGYQEQRARIRALAREALDKMMADAKVEVLIAPGGGPASVVDPVNGGPFFGSPSNLPAISGYPHLSVPMGYVSGLPVGLNFVGPRWSEARLLALGYAFEQAAHVRQDPTFPPNQAARPDVAKAYDPR
jgi:amidase